MWRCAMRRSLLVHQRQPFVLHSVCIPPFGTLLADALLRLLVSVAELRLHELRPSNRIHQPKRSTEQNNRLIKTANFSLTQLNKVVVIKSIRNALPHLDTSNLATSNSCEVPLMKFANLEASEAPRFL